MKSPAVSFSRNVRARLAIRFDQGLEISVTRMGDARQGFEGSWRQLPAPAERAERIRWKAGARGLAQKKIAVAVQRGVNDYGDQETDVTRTQNKSRQLVANRKGGSKGHGKWPDEIRIGSIIPSLQEHGLGSACVGCSDQDFFGLYSRRAACNGFAVENRGISGL